MTIGGQYVGSLPKEEGSYYCFDLMSDDQWVAKLFREAEGSDLKVLCGRDNLIHDAVEHNLPNIRWIRITPLTKVEIEAYLEIPA